MSDGNPEVNTAPVVLIGPVRVGKSVAGVAELMPRRGTDAADDDFEGYVAATARHMLYAHLDAVITMGAGHTHYRSRQRQRTCSPHSIRCRRLRSCCYRAPTRWTRCGSCGSEPSLIVQTTSAETTATYSPSGCTATKTIDWPPTR